MNLNTGEETWNHFHLEIQHSVTWHNCIPNSQDIVTSEAAAAFHARGCKESCFSEKFCLNHFSSQVLKGQTSRESQSKSSWISSLLLCRFFNGGRCRGAIDWGCIPAEAERERGTVSLQEEAKLVFDFFFLLKLLLLYNSYIYAAIFSDNT